MTISEAFKGYLGYLFAGRRCEARQLIMDAQDRGIPASKLLQNVIWPAMEQIEKLYRGDHISSIVEHMATRINRQVTDQLQCLLTHKPRNGKRMVLVCGDGEAEELGAQITADMFEAEGWSVWFLGSGVPNDEILQFLGKLRPEVFTIYGAKPSSAPTIRRMIEIIRQIGACTDMQILVTGGVFNRAPGLAEEVKTDLFAPSISEAIRVVEEHPVRVPQTDVPQPGRRRKLKRKAKKVRLAMKA